MTKILNSSANRFVRREVSGIVSLGYIVFHHWTRN